MNLEMTTTEARNTLIDVDIEEALRFAPLVGFTHTYETPIWFFTWALDWAFGRDQVDEQEIPLEEQLRMWEKDELRKIQEEHERSSGPSHVVVGSGAEQKADEWILTSVWISKDWWDGYQGGWYCVV
jgi:hypothetical protein